MSQGGEKAEPLLGSNLDFGNLKDSPDPEAVMIRLQVIAGLRDSISKFKLLEALRANDNLTVEELLQLINIQPRLRNFLRAQFISQLQV